MNEQKINVMRQSPQLTQAENEMNQNWEFWFTQKILIVDAA
jgi:hypothetical protein